MNKSEMAFALMTEHRTNCAHITLSVFAADFGLDPDLALRIAMGFGGGMGRTGRTCGAVSAAYIILGLTQTVNKDNPRETINRTYALMADFNRQFTALHGSLNCTELLRCNLSVPEELAAARDRNLFTSVCPVYVRDAVNIIESILKNPH